PGPLRRRLLPVPGADGAVAAGGGLRRRRGRAEGPAPARPEPRARALPATRRVRDLPDARPAQRGTHRLPPRRPAPRRQHGHARLADGAPGGSPPRALGAESAVPRPEAEFARAQPPERRRSTS